MTARIVIAGTASGVGKTTTVVALVRALRARGLRVAVFKCGPDYLDPTYHARAAERTSHNLDGFMMGRDAVRSTFVQATRDADVAVIEGVMGLYDGASPTGEEGSSAEIAKWLQAPVLLVCDASGMARSIAALARGFAAFDPQLKLAGVLCNRVGSRGHLDLLRKAVAGWPPILGGLPADDALAFPERHLGLRTAERAALPEALFAAWGERAAEWIDLDAVLEHARAVPELSLPDDEGAPATSAATSPMRCRIAVAQDEAFHFYYADNLRRLERLGAELVPFSPLRDASLPAVDGVLIGGGYPELHVEALGANRALRSALAAFAAAGGPIYAECGGLMYLCAAIRTLDGSSHPMVGLFPGEAVMSDRLQALGYVEVETQEATLLGPAGSRFRGHQFRYSGLVGVPEGATGAYSVRRRRGGETTREGYRAGNALGSYVHAHWASNPRIALNLVAACARFGSER
jgi:cobyrinic acid a,c-diamide synthase